MLAVKTACRNRWHQILNEAGQITTKHLLTLQEGVLVLKSLGMRVDHCFVPFPCIQSVRKNSITLGGMCPSIQMRTLF